MDKRDRNSHHSKNYLVIFGYSGVDGLKALVNASDKTNALRVALNRYSRTYPDKEISRARVAGVFDAQKKTIKKRIVID